MEFLGSRAALKAAAQKVHLATLSLSQMHKMTANDVAEILAEFIRTDEMTKLPEPAVRLSNALDEARHEGLSYLRTRDLISLSFAGEPYQVHRQNLKSETDFRFIFKDAALPDSDLEDGDRIHHPYPFDLKPFPELECWRARWNGHNVSTKERPFFPPMLPSEYFAQIRPRYELRRDWRRGHRTAGSIEAQCGSCCVLVRDQQRRLVGGASWRWWGEGCVNGVGFSLYLRRETGWLKILMDLRPYRADPSYGPTIFQESDGDGEFIGRCLKELINLRPLPAE